MNDITQKTKLNQESWQIAFSIFVHKVWPDYENTIKVHTVSMRMMTSLCIRITIMKTHIEVNTRECMYRVVNIRQRVKSHLFSPTNLAQT